MARWFYDLLGEKVGQAEYLSDFRSERLLRAVVVAMAIAVPVVASAPAAADRVMMGPPAPGDAAVTDKQARGLPLADDPLPVASFNSELAELMAEAAELHPLVAAQRAALRAAGVDVTAAWLARLPTMSVQLSQYAVQGNNSQGGNRGVMASVDMPLWANGRINATIDRARAAREVQIYRLAETVLDLQLQVNQYYHETKRLSERERALARTVDIMAGMVASMERRVAQDVSPRADLQLATSRKLQVQQQLDVTRALRDSALSHLKKLVQRDDVILLPSFVEPPAWPKWQRDAAIEQAVAVSPQRHRTEAEARLARDDARIAAAARLPGLYGFYSYDDVYKSRVGVTVRMQSAGGFSEVFSARAAGLRAEANALQVPVVEQDLRTIITTDLVEYNSAQTRGVVARALTGDSQLITESYMRQFTSGRRTWLDVMNAVRETMSAELDEIDTRYSASGAAMRIMLRTGAAPANQQGQKPQ